jgi:hypothetical protein
LVFESNIHKNPNKRIQYPKTNYPKPILRKTIKIQYQSTFFFLNPVFQNILKSNVPEKTCPNPYPKEKPVFLKMKNKTISFRKPLSNYR